MYKNKIKRNDKTLKHHQHMYKLKCKRCLDTHYISNAYTHKIPNIRIIREFQR